MFEGYEKRFIVDELAKHSLNISLTKDNFFQILEGIISRCFIRPNRGISVMYEEIGWLINPKTGHVYVSTPQLQSRGDLIPWVPVPPFVTGAAVSWDDKEFDRGMFYGRRRVSYIQLINNLEISLDNANGPVWLLPHEMLQILSFLGLLYGKKKGNITGSSVFGPFTVFKSYSGDLCGVVYWENDKLEDRDKKARKSIFNICKININEA